MTDSIRTRDGERYKNKKDLILAVKEGEIPVLEATSIYSKTKPLNQLLPGEYFVVGPESTNRKWYAQISIMRGGKIHVR